MSPLASLADAARHGLWRFWTAVSLAAADAPGLLPQRMWAFATGLRRRDAGLLRLALARRTPQTQEALLRFVAGRLAQRHDEDSLELLRRWRQGDAVARQRAADAVLGDEARP